jgi:hypothetical protein
MALAVERPIAITANWNPRAEAFFFWRLIRLERIAGGKSRAWFRAQCELAEKEILMTTKQALWLIQQHPLDANVIKQIYYQRKETCRAFRFLRANPRSAPKFRKSAQGS